jgi:hypothetical protein
LSFNCVGKKFYIIAPQKFKERAEKRTLLKIVDHGLQRDPDLLKVIGETHETSVHQTRPDQTRPDQTRPDHTTPHQTRPDKTRQDQTRPDKTNPNKTRQG